MAEEWYYARDGQQHGPVNGERLKELATSGKLQPTDLVWREGMAEWAQAGTVKGLLLVTSGGPPPLPSQASSCKRPSSPACGCLLALTCFVFYFLFDQLCRVYNLPSLGWWPLIIGGVIGIYVILISEIRK